MSGGGCYAERLSTGFSKMRFELVNKLLYSKYKGFEEYWSTAYHCVILTQQKRIRVSMTRSQKLTSINGLLMVRYGLEQARLWLKCRSDWINDDSSSMPGTTFHAVVTLGLV